MASKTSIVSNSTWQNRAELSIAQGALTNSKRPECLVKGVYPTHLTKGQGPWVTDTEGKRYLDFICGLGSNILGHGNVDVANAIAERAWNGVTLSLGTDLEVRTAEKVKELFPFIERLKFLKSGTDACNAAIRIARAKTGRHLVLSEGYHGWGDDFVSLTEPGLGVPPRDCIAKLENMDLDLFNAAAVIVEPVSTDFSPARRQWLNRLREKCTELGVMLIFDEIITGFRFPKMSVSNYWGITPDLICLGKAMANGMPVSVVGGSDAIMNCGEYFVSSTFAGETCSLAAANQTMLVLQTKRNMDELWEKGELFLREFNKLLPDQLWIEGYPTRGVFRGDPMTKALFFQEACRSHILFGPSFFFNFSHIPVMDSVLNTCKDIATRIKTGSVKLKGEMPATPFAQKVRNA